MKQGFIFIVPNQAINGKRESAEFMQRWITLNGKSFSPLGIELSEDETYIQVWVGNEENDNWTCDGENHFPSYLPLSILKDVKEGETINLKWNGEDVRLRASQLEYRYRKFGKFEDVLKSII